MSAVVFDLDGTLVDSLPDIHAAVAAMLAETGTPALPPATVRGFVGEGVAKLVERVLVATDTPRDLLPERLASFSRHYAAAPARATTVFPGVLAALEALAARGHRLALCTNKPEAPARAILDAFGLAPHIEAVIGGDSLAVRKPDPAPLRAAFRALGSDAGVFVGDSHIDALTAARAGVPFVLFTEGYRSQTVEELAPSAAFARFEALPGLVEAWAAPVSS